jgi:thiamine-phosphate diphosphorylase / hydroxyethylthiazole kinase
MKEEDGPVDYSLYLVTDSAMVPEGKTFISQIRDAITHGASVVQLREKNKETKEFVELALQVKELTKAFGVPLIINDRLDVALAVDADGVHVGQDDMDVAVVRKYLGPNKIVGVSVNNIKEAEVAIQKDIDYVGIGAVFGTLTKNLKVAPIGPSGVRDVLRVLKGSSKPIKSVAIGGINHSNIQFVRQSCQIVDYDTGNDISLDGVAVVSAIMSSEDAVGATKELCELWATPHSVFPRRIDRDPIPTLADEACSVICKIGQISPLVHHITNAVVKNFSANITIAAGASPVMSECPQEFDDFSKIPNSALLVNIGMATHEGITMFQEAIRAYNAQGKPVVFDPVGAGASTHRKNAVKTLLNTGLFSVIKGNEGEIMSVAGLQGDMKGVDSISRSSRNDRISGAVTLATEHRTTVLMTGKTDILASGLFPSSVLEFSTGHDYLGQITGSGCVLGSLITACCAVLPENSFISTATALLLYTIAAERAGPKANGPGTFVPVLIDAVRNLCEETRNGSTSWIREAIAHGVKVVG